MAFLTFLWGVGYNRGEVCFNCKPSTLREDCPPLYVGKFCILKNLLRSAVYRVALGGIRFGSLGIPTNMREGQAILVKKPWTMVLTHTELILS